MFQDVGFGIGAGTYGSLFYVTSGVAIAHVAGGVALLAMVLSRSIADRPEGVRHDPVQAAAIYWHFVVVITVVVYVAFYLVAVLHPKGS